MQKKSFAVSAGILVTSAVLLTGCNSGSSAAPSPSASSSAAKSSSPLSTLASSSPGSSPQTTPASPTSASSTAAATFTKGQKVTTKQAAAIVEAAVQKAGGTVQATGKTSLGTLSIQTKYVGQNQEAKAEGTVLGKSITAIEVDGVTYLHGLGIGPKPYLKITPTSTGLLAQTLKPLTKVTDTSSLPGGGTWTVASTSPQRTILTVSAPAGSSSTLTLNGQNLPVSLVTKVAGKSTTLTYTGYGKPVSISAPPASQVADISSVKLG